MQTLDFPEFLPDGEEIKQSLGRVLSGAVAGVDDGYSSSPLRFLQFALPVITDDDDIGLVTADDFESISDGFTLGGGRKDSGAIRADYGAAEFSHGNFMAEFG